MTSNNINKEENNFHTINTIGILLEKSLMLLILRAKLTKYKIKLCFICKMITIVQTTDYTILFSLIFTSSKH